MSATKVISRTAKAQTAAKAPAKAAKPRTTRKATQAPQTAAKAVLTVASIKFLITSRPGSGNGLASYSAAWMSITGFDNGAILPRATIIKIAGDTALKYHLNQGNFEEVSTGVQITAQGKLHFAGKSDAMRNRNIRPIPEYVESFKNAFLTGALADNVGLKNPESLKAVSF